MTLLTKLRTHHQRGGGWEVAQVVSSKLPWLPLPRRARWKMGRAHELDFWDRFYKTRGLYWPDSFDARFDTRRPLDTYVANVVARLQKQRVKILDVGAGPMTNLSYGMPGYQLTITAVDPLAKFYARILAKYGFKAPIPTQYAEAESLSETFDENSFDVVCARNAIDHSFDPLKSIREMLKVCVSGGYVALQHRPNEAVREKWIGMHQWNFAAEGERFVISNREGATDVNAALGGLAEIDLTLTTDPDWLVVRMKKR